MSRISLPKATWVCVNPGAAYASGVEVIMNVEQPTASIFYEFKNGNTVAPTQASDITEAVQSLSVKAVDGKGYLWLFSQNVAVDVQLETITPAFTSITFPTGMATEAKQDDQIAELVGVRSVVEKTSAAPSGKTPVLGTFNAVGVSAIFEPIAGRDFNIQVIFGSGANGSVQLEQSLDSINFYPLTGSGVEIMRFNKSAVEQWSNNEVGTQFRLRCTAISGGSVDYRISQ